MYAVQLVFACYVVGEFLYVEVGFLYEFHKVRWGAGVEPVAAISFLVQCPQYAERVVYAIGGVAEVVAVVVTLECGICLVLGLAVVVGKQLYLTVEHMAQFLGGDATYIVETGAHGDVVEVVEVAEDAHLAELGHAGEEGKLEVGIGTLQNAVEGLEGVAELVLQRGVTNGLQDGLVVLVDEYNGIAAGLDLCSTDDGAETSLNAGVNRFAVV